MFFVGDTIYILSRIGNLEARLWSARLLGGLGVVLGWWGGGGPWFGGLVGCPWFGGPFLYVVVFRA
jgi:hypothetical protein